MKKIFNKIFILFTATLFLAACEDQELAVYNDNAETIVSLSSNTVVLDILNSGQEALAINWTDPDYGFNAGPNYQITFKSPEKSSTLSVGNVLTKSFETSELNKLLLELGLTPGESSEILITVEGILSTDSSAGASSNTSTLTATPYSTDFSPIYMIGSALKGWDTTLAVEVYGIGPGTYQVIAQFQNDGAFRFFDQPDWGATSYNYPYFGTGADPAYFENANDGDSNLKFIGATGYYTIIVNLIDKTIAMTPTAEPVRFIVGAGVPAAGWGWDTPVQMTFVQDGIFSATTQFANDGFRFFTADGDWGSGQNYPYFANDGFIIDNNFENANDGDSNFKFVGTPGTYTVTVNYIDKIITLE
jgi:hypothetical protein